MFHLSYIILASKVIENTSKLLSPLLWLANKTQTSLHNRISFQFPLPVNVCPRSLPWNKFPIISRAVQNNFSSLLPPWAVAVPFVNNGNNGRDVFLGLESEDGRGKRALFFYFRLFQRTRQSKLCGFWKGYGVKVIQCQQGWWAVLACTGL